MESEGALSFDFEGGLDAGPANPSTTAPPDHHRPAVGQADVIVNDQAPGSSGGRRNFRQTVCRHWLRGLCMKGDTCGFLHQYDKSRMPVCRFFRLYGECREQDCMYKHTTEDAKECNMYKLGFCPNGPDCRYKHAKLPGPPPSVGEVLQKIQHLNSYNHGNSNKRFQQRNSGNMQTENFQISRGHDNQGGLVRPSTVDFSIQQQQYRPVHHSQQQVIQAPLQYIPTGQPNQTNGTSIRMPQEIPRCVQSSNVSK